MIRSPHTTGRWLCLATLLLFAFSLIAPQVMADSACPQGMSQVDCAAIYGNWENWIPDDGGSCTTVDNGGTIGTLPSGVPAPYNAIITQAAAKFDASAALEAAIFYWENRGFPDPNQKWSTSPAGAQGPMQFLPATFKAYAVDGNNDGVKDIDNIYDALFTGAKYIAAQGGRSELTLGTISQPLKPNTLLRVAAAYNWGGGNVQNAGPDAPMSALPQETQDYVKAVYVLISSNFTQKPVSGSGSVSGGGSGTATTVDTTTDNCSSTGAAIGSGTGKFTDDTAITIPGVAKALANAKKFAAESIAELGSTVCVGGAGTGCYNQCDHLVAQVWGHASSGFNTAQDHWNAAVAAGVAHPGDRNVPVGALLFYSTSSDGHVAVYLGNNLVLSNDVNDPAGTTLGGAYIVSASKIEQGGWNLPYLGWVNPVPWL